jgi:uncharacterized membrane protein
MTGNTARVLVQVLLLLPTLSAAAVLPLLLVAVPELLSEGKWLGAFFNALALPGYLALIASVVLPQNMQMRGRMRSALVAGLVMALAACIALALIMTIRPDGGIRLPREPMQLALTVLPLAVALWNLKRLSGRAFNWLAGAAGAIFLLSLVWIGYETLSGCTRDYNPATGEHTACR